MRRMWLFAAVLIVVACGQTTPVAHVSSPSPAAASPSARSSPSQGAPSPSPSPTPSPTPVATRLVVQDYSKNQVRLARFDAVDVATVAGNFDGVVAGQVIVVNGQNLVAVRPNGAVTALGHLAGAPEWSGPGTVAVNPTLSQWFYTVVNFTNLASQIHLGSPSSDRIVATIASPDGNAFYQAYAWNPSGTYMVKEATGLGGVGPFLEYHFPLATLDLTTAKVTVVSPQCIAEGVFNDGTRLCHTSSPGGLEVRSPGGASHTVQVAGTSNDTNGLYAALTVSPDRSRFVLARNGNPNPNLVNYQMATGALSGSSAATFGPADFYPDVWLPDGRIVADHRCWDFQSNGGPCNSTLNGTYFISVDGSTKTLFFKLAQGVTVVAAVW